MTEHRPRRWVDERGYWSSCQCGWSAKRRTRELRDQDHYAHELEDSLTVRRIERRDDPVTPNGV